MRIMLTWVWMTVGSLFLIKSARYFWTYCLFFVATYAVDIDPNDEPIIEKPGVDNYPLKELGMLVWGSWSAWKLNLENNFIFIQTADYKKFATEVAQRIAIVDNGKVANAQMFLGCFDAQLGTLLGMFLGTCWGHFRETLEQQINEKMKKQHMISSYFGLDGRF